VISTESPDAVLPLVSASRIDRLGPEIRDTAGRMLTRARWDYGRDGAIDKASVAAQHGSVPSSRIAPNVYAAGSEWTLTRRASRLYVVAGTAQLTVGEQAFTLAAGDIVDLPAGEIVLEVGSSMLDVVSVWDPGG